MKRYLFIFFLFSFSSNIFSLTVKYESFVIHNYSSKNVIITRDFFNDISKAINSKWWEQNIQGLNLTIGAPLLESREIVLAPNKVINIVEYYPWAPVDSREIFYDQLNQIPFLNKMRSIFKFLKIEIEDGTKFITLENLGEQIIKKNVTIGGVSFHLEIFDYDYIGKTATEW